MNFEVDDLDWAMGELANLFAKANEVGIYPHLLDPKLFYDAWTVLDSQPLAVRLRCRDKLLLMLTTIPLWKTYSNGTVVRLLKSAKRYENTFTY